MKALGLALAIGCLTAAQAATAGSHFEWILQHLAPSARLEQICDYTAMQKIRGTRHYRPDRAVGSAVSSAKIHGNTLDADGAAFRSRGKWYRLSYTCSTTPDRMKVVSFTFKIGAAIPESKWAGYGLWR
jgi:hypothetical protein